MDATAEELKKLRELRKNLANKLAKSTEATIGHIENGSYELVEEALIECQEGICDLRDKLAAKSTKRRTRNAETIKQASQAG